MGRKIQLDKYVIGRSTYRRMRKAILLAVTSRLAMIGRFIMGSRPARWIARQRTVRFVVGVLALLWSLAAKFIWLPVTQFIRRTRRYLGRHEVWVTVLAWTVCAYTGTVIARTWDTMDPVWLKLVGGIIAVCGYVLTCIYSPLAGLMIWLSTSPMSKALIQYKFLEGMPVLTADAASIAILFVAYILQRKNIVKHEPVRILHLFITLFILGELIAAFRTEVPKRSAQMVVDQYLSPFMAYLFARRWITTRKQLAMFFLVVLVIGSYFVAFAVPEHFTGRNFFSPTGRSMYIEYGLDTVRAQGPAGSPQEFGLVLALVACVALVRYAYESSKYRRMLVMAVAMMAFVGIAFTLRRSVYVGAAFTLLFLVFGSHRVRKVSTTALVVIVLLLVAVYGPLSKTRLFSERLTDVNPIRQRAVIQATAWNIFKHNPILGLGFDKYGEGNAKYLVPYKDIMPFYGSGFTSPHSSYLRIMVDGGLVAFIPFVGFVLMLFVTTYQMYKRARGPGLLGRDGIIVFWAFAVGVLIQSLSTDSFFHNKYLITLWLFYYGALSGVHMRKEMEPEEPVAVQAPDKKRLVRRTPRRQIARVGVK